MVSWMLQNRGGGTRSATLLASSLWCVSKETMWVFGCSKVVYCRPHTCHQACLLYLSFLAVAQKHHCALPSLQEWILTPRLIIHQTELGDR